MAADGNFAPKYPGNQPSTDAPPVLSTGASFGPTSSALPSASTDAFDAPSPDLPSTGSPAEAPTSPPVITEGGQLTPAGQPFSFGPPPPQPCSISRCACGHVWTPELRIARCPGCQAPMLVLLMQNCPACNEPTAATDLRLDHMPAASAQLMPLCRGSATLAEALRIELRHTHAEDEQRDHKVREVVSKL